MIRGTKVRRVLLALTVMLLMAAACGDTDANTEAETAVSDDAGLETAVSDDADVESTGSTEPTTTDPVELTASDTGVTETAIRVGVFFPDTTIIGRQPGDLEAKFQTAVDAINDAGGINGRVIEMTYRSPSPIDDTPWEAACVEMVEDVEVFAVVGLFLRATADCFTRLNDTPVISAFPITAESMRQATVPAITTQADPLRLVESNIGALVEAGVIDDSMSIAVVGSSATEEQHDAYLAALEAAGIAVAAEQLVLGDGQDTVALTAEMGTLAEVWKASGADAVLATSAAVANAMLIAYNNSDIDLPMVLPDGTATEPSLMRDFQGLDLAPFENATSLVGDPDTTTQYTEDLNGVRACVDRFVAATGEEVPLDGESDNLDPTMFACQVFDVFAQIAEAAGPELTRASFAEALEEIGGLEVTGLSATSLGPEKWDLPDATPVVASYDAALAQFLAVE